MLSLMRLKILQRWHLKARNTTFRAVNEAFRKAFPQMRDIPGTIRMVTEPEACAQYIMHRAKEAGLAGLKRVWEIPDSWLTGPDSVLNRVNVSS